MDFVTFLLRNPSGIRKINMDPMKLRDALVLACVLWALGTAIPARAAAPSPASDPVAEQVRERFVRRFPDMPPAAVRRTPYGLYEVQAGMNLLYTDEQVTWAMQGPLIDARTRRDVTRERIAELTAIDFDDLPLDLAIRQVKGTGARKVAIFEDPNCGYCKQLRKTLEGVDDVTIYTFLYPILAPDSRAKSRDVWCAPDRGAAWDDWMVRGRVPPAAQCDGTPMDRVLALGQRLMVRGTPTLFFPSGRRLSGALPAEQLQARLDGR